MSYCVLKTSCNSFKLVICEKDKILTLYSLCICTVVETNMLQFVPSETLLCVDCNDCFVLYNGCAWCGVMNQMCHSLKWFIYEKDKILTFHCLLQINALK